jgi:hypothetical protein
MVFLIFVKTLNDKIMKKQLYFTTVLLLTILFYSSCKKCPDENNIRNTYSVNQADLPIIIPYNDTSKVRFLKNGIDTLTFTSQGLKSTYTIQGFADGECAGKNKFQQCSLKMICNDDEFFETYYTFQTGLTIPIVKVNINNNLFEKTINDNEMIADYFIRYYPPAFKFNLNGLVYDSITPMRNSYDSLIFKPKLGFIYFKINGNRYQIIRE